LAVATVRHARIRHAPSLPDKARIELNRLSAALSRCVDQAECDKIMARMREIEGSWPKKKKTILLVT
jgi:hypothetical protein